MFRFPANYFHFEYYIWQMTMPRNFFLNKVSSTVSLQLPINSKINCMLSRKKPVHRTYCSMLPFPDIHYSTSLMYMCNFWLSIKTLENTSQFVSKRTRDFLHQTWFLQILSTFIYKVLHHFIFCVYRVVARMNHSW